MNLKRALLSLFILMLLAGQSTAALKEEVKCNESKNRPLIYVPSQSHTLDLFDPDWGTLVRVDVNLNMDSHEVIKYQNQDTYNKNVQVTSKFGLNVTMPNGSKLGVEFSNVTRHAVNNTTFIEYHFADPDGFNFTRSSSTNATISYTDPANLTYFTAMPGDGTKTFPIATYRDIRDNDTGNKAVYYNVSAVSTMCVKYTYEPKLNISGYKINYCTHETMAGWTIRLKNETGAEINSTTTGSDGIYKFRGLFEGNYTVCEDLKPGWTNVTPPCIKVPLSTEDVINQNFTNRPLLCINGTKTLTCPGDLSNWTITLKNATTGATVGTRITDANGTYSFCNLLPGNYTVEETLKSGWHNLTPRVVTVTLICDPMRVDFRNEPLLCIDVVKIDNCTGLPLPDWPMTLENTSGLSITGSTDLSGHWRVCDLYPGEYRVCEGNRPGWINVTPLCQNVTLNCTNETVEFRNSPPLFISGYKLDNSGEVLAGWTIILYNETGSEIDSNTTDAQGRYSFCGLLPGDYRVCEEDRPGWKNVTPSCIDIVGLACDNMTNKNFTNCNVTCIGGYKLDNFGEVLAGWTIFIDLNDNGILDAGEPSNVTDANGYWKICGLCAGDRVNVTEVLEGGWMPDDPATGRQNVTILPNNQTGYVNFTNKRVTCIDGYKLDNFGTKLSGWTIFIDLNHNGILDAGEPSNVTDANGYWKICGLCASDRVNVTEVLKGGWRPHDPPTGWQEIEVKPNNGTGYINFTNFPYNLCISGYKINNCTRETIQGWTIRLKNETGAEINSTITGTDGRYEFCGLVPGNYTICEDIIPGWKNVTETCIGVPLADVDVINRNFTNDPPGCIYGHKFDNTSKRGLEGWTILLYNETEVKLGEQKTDSEGRYEFCGLVPGDYCVCEVLQDKWNNVTPLCQNVTLSSCRGAAVDFYNGNITIDKVADKLEVKGGEEVTYTITFCNHGGAAVTNVTIWDVFNRYVEILSVTPPPGPDGKWHFPVIEANDCVKITITVKVPESQDFEFGMQQKVSGEGFVKASNSYNTNFKEYLIENCAYATSDLNSDPISDCATVKVGEELGTELETREYGSGRFESEETITIFTENKSIEMEKDISAAYEPTSIQLYNNRTIFFDSSWVNKARGKNRVTGASMVETYHDLVSIDRESRMFLDRNKSAMGVNSEFEGRGHIRFVKMPTNSSTPQATPLFEGWEDYTGSFKVLEQIGEYGSAVSSEKAASGTGMVVVDKRVGDSQRSYESGSGSYDSQELIETYTNYIAKDIGVAHAPTSQNLTGNVSVNSSMRWKEGMYSRVREISYIGEEYASITDLDKETVARGLNEMDTLANFSGQARYRAILNGEVDFDEAYSGDYSVERRVMFSGTAKYDRPHLNVTKTLDGIVEETEPWGYNETHLPGEEKIRKIATYTITIENDGNAALGPILVKDTFPPGAVFVQPSSLRPTRFADTSVNWTLTHLAIGDAVTITLKLDLTRSYPQELTNRVEVCGGINNGAEYVCASNFSARELSWLTCCTNQTISVTKTARLDDTNSELVWYTVEIRNDDNATRAATVTDRLPTGMELVSSSIPFASRDGNVVVWNLVEIGPFETERIEFSALAPGVGRFSNLVEVEARSVDGPVVQPVYASCVIDVGEVEDECGPISCQGWQPPDWNFKDVGTVPWMNENEFYPCK